MKTIFLFLIIVAPILLLFSIIDYFSYKNWTSVYTSLNDENYFRAVGKLQQAGIRYRTKSQFDLITTPMFGGNRQRQYEIFVKKQDVDHAYHKLNS